MANETIYIINSTDSDPGKSFAIQPRAYNGVGGVQQSTDLTLYGNAAPNWGERFNENFYHLLENFACPESTITPGIPADGAELGEGFGINSPIVGQVWFNTDEDTLYVYTTGEIWSPVTVEAPVSSVNGKVGAVVLDSSDWPVNSVNSKVGDVTLVASDLSDVYSITQVDSLITTTQNLIYSTVDDYVELAGDTMTGALKFNTTAADSATFVFQHQPSGALQNLHRFTNSTTGTGSNDGFAIGIQTDGTAIIQNHENKNINFYTNNLLRMVLQSGGNLSLQNNKIVNISNPTSNLDAANKQYVDSLLSGIGGGITNQSLTTSGYVQFENGWMVQWGRNSGSGSFWVNFPLAFSVATYVVTGSIISSIDRNFSVAGAPTVSGFNAWHGDTAGGGMWETSEWVAIGRWL